jgi:hypothetical protein
MHRRQLIGRMEALITIFIKELKLRTIQETFERNRIIAGMVIVLIAQTVLGQQTPAEPAATTPETEAAPAAWPPGLLMDGLGAFNAKKSLESLGLRTWGFLESGYTGRLTGGQDPLPLRVFEARRPNNARLNQLRLTLDRPYDTSKPFDLGGRIDGLFGGDAMLTHSPGLFDKAGHGDGDAWADMVQGYGQMWFKTGDDSGLEVLFGKFATTHGIEVIDAVGNPLYSHSYLFGYAIPFTHTGVKANYVFNTQASAYFAVVEGWEVFNDNNHAHSYMTGGALSGSEQIDGHARSQLFLNVITGPEQESDVNNYRTVFDATGTYWWTSKLSQSLNGDYGTEENAPDVGAARWYGLANYYTYVFCDKLSGTWRLEWFRDDGGSRTGRDGSFYESTWGVTITPAPDHAQLKYLSLRPELRWDFSDQETFGSDRQNQLTAAIDVLYKF